MTSVARSLPNVRRLSVRILAEERKVTVTAVSPAPSPSKIAVTIRRTVEADSARRSPAKHTRTSRSGSRFPVGRDATGLLRIVEPGVIHAAEPMNERLFHTVELCHGQR